MQINPPKAFQFLFRLYVALLAHLRDTQSIYKPQICFFDIYGTLAAEVLQEFHTAFHTLRSGHLVVDYKLRLTIHTLDNGLKKAICNMFHPQLVQRCPQLVDKWGRLKI